MRRFSNAPGGIVPPPVPDPRADGGAADAKEVLRRFDLEVDDYLLYSGNLDAYQEIELLEAAALELSRRPDRAPPIVLASHDPRVLEPSRPGIRPVVVSSAGDMQALLAGAKASIVMRQALGGFPIKLANSLAAGTPVICFHAREWGLTDAENSLICSQGLPPASALADAIDRLTSEPGLDTRLAVGARRLYERQHSPPDAAAATLEIVERARAACLSRRDA